jgi:hypothetical protein
MENQFLIILEAHYHKISYSNQVIIFHFLTKGNNLYIKIKIGMKKNSLTKINK